MNYALILAGGSGIRAGGGTPKQFREVLGKPVVYYTIEAYQNHPEIDAILVGCHADWLDYLKELIDKSGFTKVKWISVGGDTFQKTVMNAVSHLDGKIGDDDIVAVQYGACPFVKAEIISDGLRVAHEKGMSFAASPCFHLMGTNDGDESRTYIDHDKCVQVASPQSYRFGYIKEIYAEGEKRGLLETVDPHTTSLMCALGLPLYQSYSDQTNIKITIEEDFDLLEAWLLLREKRAKEAQGGQNGK